MTSLAEVLAAHSWRPGRAVSYMGGCGACAFHGDSGQFVAHQVEAIAAAGLAVVELPEPTWHKDADEDENAASAWEYPDGEVVVYDDGFFEWRSFGINNDNASRLRDAAAALIAAANAAEAGTS